MEPSEWQDHAWVLDQRLLSLLRRTGVGSVSELDEWLSTGLDRAVAILQDITRLCLERGFRPFAVREDLVVFLVLVLSRADGEAILLAEYAHELDYALNTLSAIPMEHEEE